MGHQTNIKLHKLAPLAPSWARKNDAPQPPACCGPLDVRVISGTHHHGPPHSKTACRFPLTMGLWEPQLVVTHLPPGPPLTRYGLHRAFWTHWQVVDVAQLLVSFLSCVEVLV